MTELQAKILEIFIVVEEICKKHNLRYYAIGGTCIGAVRHKGFIPWDDDMDISMPDRDFLKFMEIAPKELPYPFELIPIAGLPHSPCLHAKVQNTETAFIESSDIKCPDSYKGVFLDIFPLFGLPDRAGRRILFSAKLLFLKQVNEKKKIRFSNYTKARGRILWIMVNGFLPVHFFPISFWANRWLKSVFRYSFDRSKYVRSSGPRCIYKSEWYHKGVQMPFEDTTIICPEKWNSVLKVQYGDYMKLPPESEQVAVHSGGIVDLERSYKYYAEKKRRETAP